MTVKLDGKRLEEIGEQLRAEAGDGAAKVTVTAPEVPQGDGLKTPRAVGATEGEVAPVAPKRIGEAGVRHTKKFLTCKLTDPEIATIHGEIVAMVGEASQAERRVESIKERAKADVQVATNALKELRERLDDKARITREGKVDREVPVTIRIDWRKREKTTIRDDTGEVLSTEAATPLEVADCGVWEKDLKAGKSYLKAPDGAVLDERNLTDAERQTSLPLADGGAAPTEPAKAERAWLPVGAWDDLSDDVSERLTKPDPHGKAPTVTWTADGKWMVGEVPAGLRPALDHHAVQAGVALHYGETAPTLADLAAASKEPAGKPRKGAAKKASTKF